MPSTGSIVDLAASNWNTAAGAACFLVCALAGLRASPEDHPTRVTGAAAPAAGLLDDPGA